MLEKMKKIKMLQKMRKSRHHLNSSVLNWTLEYWSRILGCGVLLDLSTWRFISLKYLEEYFSKILGGERRAKAFNCSVLLEYVVGVCCWIAYVGVHSLIQVFPCWRCIAWKYLEEAGEPKHASPQLINSQRGLKIKFWSLMHINIFWCTSIFCTTSFVNLPLKWILWTITQNNSDRIKRENDTQLCVFYDMSCYL